LEHRIEESFVTDNKGHKIAVQVPIRVYRKLIADSEELNDINEYRKAKAHKGNAIPFEQAFKEIEEAIISKFSPSGYGISSRRPIY